MKKTMVLFQIFVYAFILGGCASNKVATQIDCRELIKEDLVQKEIQSDLANRFPNHKEAFISNTGLILQGEGVRHSIIKLFPDYIYLKNASKLNKKPDLLTRFFCLI